MNKNLLTHLGVGIGAAAIGAGVTVGLALGGQLGLAPETAAPAACLTALDAADELLVINADLSSSVMDFFETMVPSSYGIVAQADDMEELSAAYATATSSVESTDYDGPATDCRGGA